MRLSETFIVLVFITLHKKHRLKLWCHTFDWLIFLHVGSQALWNSNCWFPLILIAWQNKGRTTAWVFWGRATWKDCLSLTLAVIGNIQSHFDSRDRWQFLIKLTICSFWSFTFIFLCFRKWSGNFYRKDNSHHLLLPPFDWQKQNHQAVQLPISTTSPDLFHFQLSLPSLSYCCKLQRALEVNNVT